MAPLTPSIGKFGGVKLNIGCGPNGQFIDYINIDNSPSIWLTRLPRFKRILHQLGMITQSQLSDDWHGVMKSDASKSLPFKNATVDRIYSSHFIEHIPYDKALRVLLECYRVLNDNGIMRLVVPDLLWHAEKYVAQTRQLLEKSCAAQQRNAHDEFLDTVYGAYLRRKRYGAFHCYMYDEPTLRTILDSIGFRAVQRCNFKTGQDLELASHDSRPEDSLHFEVRKRVPSSCGIPELIDFPISST